MVDLNKINIKITKSAYKKIKVLIQNDKKLKFRIYITGGGCNGFQYNFKIDTIINKNDIVINKSIIILIDCISLQYINGGKIDYQENLEGSKFIVSNPNASTTCSCGSSFGI